MNVSRISGHTGVGGIYVCSDLTEAFTCTGTITFRWERMKKSDFTKVCSAIEQGFKVSHGDAVGAVLTMLDNCDEAPNVPNIGYVGKKNMNVLVPIDKAEACKTDLIAAAHMVDVDLRTAVAIRRCDSWTGQFMWLCVDGWNVGHHVKDDEVPMSRSRWRRSGGHLKPATSKLANLVREWQKELLPLRMPLLEFVRSKPVLTFNLQTGLDL
jgi:hypothetical protein